MKTNKGSQQQLFDIVEKYSYENKPELMKDLKRLRTKIRYETYLVIRKRLLPLINFTDFIKLIK
jgi:uncharacterized protein YeeX (DUF496 family)